MMLLASTVLTLLGLAFELIGVVLLGRQFLQMALKDTLSSLLLSPFSKANANAMAAVAEVAGERLAANARGLGFVFLGVLLQILGAGADFKAKLDLHQAVSEHQPDPGQAMDANSRAAVPVPAETKEPEHGAPALPSQAKTPAADSSKLSQPTDTPQPDDSSRTSR